MFFPSLKKTTEVNDVNEIDEKLATISLKCYLEDREQKENPENVETAKPFRKYSILRNEYFKTTSIYHFPYTTLVLCKDERIGYTHVK